MNMLGLKALEGSNLIYMSGKILNEKKQIVAKGTTRLFVLTKG